jgi:hypothetical protein
MCAAVPHRPAPALIDSAIKISGFTQPRNEHVTPYRVINYHTCNSCWNDPPAAYDRHDFVLPASQGHASPIRMHAADHRGAGDRDDQAHSGIQQRRAALPYLS